MGIVKGAGNSSSVKKYSLTDPNPSEGTSYYRLKQTDMDGQYKYFQIISVTYQSKNISFCVYPNPVSSDAIHLKLTSSENILVNITSEDGKKMLSRSFSIDDTLLLDVSLADKFLPGIYFVSIVSANSIQTQRLIIVQ
jgi:hypothetical protein